jgi:hypothetical protein
MRLDFITKKDINSNHLIIFPYNEKNNVLKRTLTANIFIYERNKFMRPVFTILTANALF